MPWLRKASISTAKDGGMNLPGYSKASNSSGEQQRQTVGDNLETPVPEVIIILMPAAFRAAASVRLAGE